MSLTGPLFLGTLVVVTVAAFAAVVLAWPSLGRQGVPRVAGRIGMLLGLNGLVLLTAAAQLNAQFIFFADWTGPPRCVRRGSHHHCGEPWHHGDPCCTDPRPRRCGGGRVAAATAARRPCSAPPVSSPTR